MRMSKTLRIVFTVIWILAGIAALLLMPNWLFWTIVLAGPVINFVVLPLIYALSQRKRDR